MRVSYKAQSGDFLYFSLEDSNMDVLGLWVDCSQQTWGIISESDYRSIFSVGGND